MLAILFRSPMCLNSRLANWQPAITQTKQYIMAEGQWNIYAETEVDDINPFSRFTPRVNSLGLGPSRYKDSLSGYGDFHYKR